MSDGKKYYCFCSSNCKYETMTKEQIMAAIAHATGVTVVDPDAGFITKVKEKNGSCVTFWVGTQAQYNALQTKEENCLHIITDDTSKEDFEKTVAGIMAAIEAEQAKAIESSEHKGCYYRIVKGEKEWLNPPMVFGVEYRTTERHGGKPVYTRIVTKDIKSSDQVVCGMPEIPVRLHGWTSFDTIIPNDSPNAEWKTGYYIGDDGLHVTAGSGIVAAGNTSAWFQLWYIKPSEEV